MEKMSMSDGFLLFLILGLFLTTGAKTLKDKCTPSFTTVSPCLNFVTGKSSVPASDCCKAAKEIRDHDPECLCYFIEVAQNPKSGLAVGIQVPKLLQLPSSCNLANSSTSDCPRLLNISPNSTEYAIFTNPSPSPAASDNGLGSHGSRIKPHLTSSMAVAFAIFMYAFPSWIQIFT